MLAKMKGIDKINLSCKKLAELLEIKLGDETHSVPFMSRLLDVYIQNTNEYRDTANELIEMLDELHRYPAYILKEDCKLLIHSHLIHTYELIYKNDLDAGGTIVSLSNILREIISDDGEYPIDPECHKILSSYADFLKSDSTSYELYYHVSEYPAPKVKIDEYKNCKLEPFYNYEQYQEERETIGDIIDLPKRVATSEKVRKEIVRILSGCPVRNSFLLNLKH